MNSIRLLAFAAAFVAFAHVRAADIITCNAPAGKGSWICFRKVVDVAGDTADNSLRIAADSKYWLYLNGELVVREGQLKRGPNATDSYIDSLRLPNLRKGRNTLAVLVNYFGQGGYSHRNSPCAGLYFELRAGDATYSSDSTWKAWPHPAYYVPQGEKPNVRLPESNVGYDAAKNDGDFAAPQYDDSRHPNAVAVAESDAQWGKFHTRPIPFFKDYGVGQYVRTERRGGELVCHLPYNAQVSPRLKVRSVAGKVIGIRPDCYPVKGSEKIIRYEYLTADGEQEFEFPGWINGHSIIYTIPEGVEVVSTDYRETGYDCDLSGTFECGDSALTSLWKKAQRTLYVTMRDNFMDCPDRERAQYIGDVTNELAEMPYALSPSAACLVRKCALEVAAWQRPDGVIYAPVPAGDWKKELPQQSMAFSGLGLWDYFLYYGDTATVLGFYPALKRYVHLWNVQPDGLVGYRRGSWDWGDWGSNVDMQALNQQWYSVTLDRYSKMAAMAGDNDEAAWAASTRGRLNTMIRAQYWDGGAFVGSQAISRPDDRAQAMAVICGAAQQEDWEAIKSTLAKTQFASPYMERFVLQALCEMGATPQALERMRRRYGPMISSDYSTLWERFSLAPGTSYNHAWSGAPIIVLSRYVAGITPIRPLFREFRVRPDLAGLRFVRTTVPTPQGDIRLEVSEEAGYRISLEVPQECRAVVSLPSAYKAYKVNGESARLGTANAEERYELPLQAGSYTIEAVADGGGDTSARPSAAGADAAGAGGDVYTIAGELTGVDASDMSALPKGIYVAGGAKRLVR